MACLMAKGYSHIYGLDCGDTLSPIAKITFVYLFLAIIVICDWPLYQLDITKGESGSVCKLTMFSLWFKTITKNFVWKI